MSNTPLISQEHYDLLAHFESILKKREAGLRFDKEDKSLWVRGHIFQHGETNQLFLAFREGYALGKAVARQELEVT